MYPFTGAQYLITTEGGVILFTRASSHDHSLQRTKRYIVHETTLLCSNDNNNNNNNDNPTNNKTLLKISLLVQKLLKR